MDTRSPAVRARQLASRDDRHWVYHRTGLPCRVCGTPIAMQELGGRKLYWCPLDQGPGASGPGASGTAAAPAPSGPAS